MSISRRLADGRMGVKKGKWENEQLMGINFNRIHPVIGMARLVLDGCWC